MKLNIPFPDEVCEFTDVKKLEKTTIDVKVEQSYGSIIKKFPVLHHGWEGDGYGYVVANVVKGKLITPKLILTNHSKPYEASSNELRLKINEYQRIIGETNQVLKLLDE
jgi:hypothetical protein